MHAQVERASILGNATDNSSAAVPNVVVTVTNEATNTSVRVVTDAAGAFAVMNLIPGNYTVSAALAGFNSVTYRGVELQVGQQARLDIRTSRTRDNELWVLKSAPGSRPVKLGQKMSEGAALSKKSLKISFSQAHEQAPDLAPDAARLIVADVDSLQAHCPAASRG